jgi:hypothetical protein
MCDRQLLCPESRRNGYLLSDCDSYIICQLFRATRHILSPTRRSVHPTLGDWVLA